MDMEISNTKNSKFLDLVSKKFQLWSIENNVIAEFVRFHPLIDNHNLYKGEIIENRETIFLDLKSNFFAQYESRRKTDIKRGKERLSFENVENQLMLNIFLNYIIKI